MTEIEPSVSVEEGKVKRKRVILLAIIGIVIVVGIIAAYFILGELFKPPLPDPNELLSKNINAHKEVKTYRYKIKMEVEAYGQSWTVEGEGKVNSEERRAYMLMKTAGEISQEVYLISDMLYYRIDGKWYKRRVVGVWEQTELLPSLIKLLSKLKLKVVKVERVRGVEAYVLEGLSEKELPELVNLSVPPLTLGTGGKGIRIESLKIILWIDKQKYYTLRIEMSITTRFKSDTKVIKSDTELTMDILDINVPMTIELPPEAERAEPMPIVPPRIPS